MLSQYTKRTLTNEGDAFRALTGIMRRICDKFRQSMLSGLPVSAFDQFLLFSGNNLRRRRGFPSFSWARWRGELGVHMVHESLSVWQDNGNWIVWYKRSPNGTDEPVDKVVNTRQSAQSAIKLECMEVTSFTTTPTPFIRVTNRDDLLPPPYPVLRFWSLSLRFKIGEVDVFAATARLFDAKGGMCGVVTLDGLEDTKFFESQEPMEIILLSESKLPMPVTEDFDFDRNNRLVGTEQYGLFYNVMLLGWDGVIAERRGIGFIDKKLIHGGFAPSPVWKEITLG